MIDRNRIALILLGSMLIEPLSSAFAEPAASEVSAPTAGESSSEEAIPESASSAPSSGRTERIQVTGSNIKRIDVEGVGPVQTLQRKDLEKQGYNSVGDVLRDTSANSFGSVREDSGSNAAGTAHVDLRGLGASNTLVLLNGQRLPTDAITGAVDLNLIPMAAVERVEILKDGASAIYGSDALGGVVNIITRKDFSGNEISVQQTMPEAKGGARTQASLVNGVNSEKFNMVNVFQFRDNKRIYSRDRDWTDDGTSLIGDPGSYRNAGGQWNTDSNCPAGQIVATPQGNFCSFKHTDYSTELPALRQFSLLSESNYELSSKVRLTARLGGTHRKVNWSYAAAPGTFVIPGAVADTLGPGGTPLPGATPGQDLQARYRLTDLGTRDADVSTWGYNALLGSQIQVGDTWSMDVTGSHNSIVSNDRGVNGYALTDRLQALIASGAFNPFGSPGSKGSLESARYAPVEKTTSQITSGEVKASGELAQLPNGPIGMAVGTTAFHQSYSDEFDAESLNDNVFGNAGSTGGGQRNSVAVFSELSVPVIPDLELQLAGRFDHFSDFGNTFNPKVAASYRVTPNVLLRGSVGTGFKAPLMQDLYAASGNGFPTFIDFVACGAEQQAGGATPSCLPQQYNVTSGGNPGLREQTSIAYNAGAVVQATPALSFSGDWFLVKTKNVVGIDYNDLTRAEAAGINVNQNGLNVTRDAQGYIESILAPMQNLASQDVSGIDLSAGYSFAQFRLSSSHSYLFFFREEGFPGAGMRDKLGENGKPEWRNATSLTFLPQDNQSITATAITLGSHKKAVESAGKLSNYTTVDLQYVYQTKRIGEFTLGVRNVLGTTPPLDDSSPNEQLDAMLYDQIGRQFLAAYKINF